MIHNHEVELEWTVQTWILQRALFSQSGKPVGNAYDVSHQEPVGNSRQKPFP